jgi:hypothetical protein
VTVTEEITKHHPAGWCFFLPFQEIADVKAATFPICPLIKNETGANRSYRRDSAS